MVRNVKPRAENILNYQKCSLCGLLLPAPLLALHGGPRVQKAGQPLVVQTALHKLLLAQLPVLVHVEPLEHTAGPLHRRLLTRQQWQQWRDCGPCAILVWHDTIVVTQPFSFCHCCNCLPWPLPPARTGCSLSPPSPPGLSSRCSPRRTCHTLHQTTLQHGIHILKARRSFSAVELSDSLVASMNSCSGHSKLSSCSTVHMSAKGV